MQALTLLTPGLQSSRFLYNIVLHRFFWFLSHFFPPSSSISLPHSYLIPSPTPHGFPTQCPWIVPSLLCIGGYWPIRSRLLSEASQKPLASWYEKTRLVTCPFMCALPSLSPILLSVQWKLREVWREEDLHGRDAGAGKNTCIKRLCSYYSCSYFLTYS